MDPIFSNSQFIEWLDGEFNMYIEDAYENLKQSLKKVDPEEADDTLMWAATTKMTANANIELAHHREKLKKFCGFGDCKYIPKCIKGLE